MTVEPITHPGDGEPLRCIDCNVVVAEVGESIYMVEDRIWNEAGLARNDGHLCIGCLEKRLGRTLVDEDFPDVPWNESVDWKSERLLSRTGYREPRRINLIMHIVGSTLGRTPNTTTEEATDDER